ncbi:MAG TPA: CoA transferase, partial [Planctomycetota bacterium]|nr:CoA transferase [Planctomycetota bacterium]
MSRPLAGVRVLDLSRVLAGPFLTQMLAALGADVVKVEAPDGDPTRHLGPPEVDGASYYFHGANAGKRSLRLDLRSEAGRRVARELARRADALVENFRPGVLEWLGLSVAELRAANPRLAVLSISAVGADAPEGERDRPSFDLCVQARGGTMSVNGQAGGSPTRLGIPMGDLAGSFYGAIALLAALVARARGGEGTWIDLSLLDAQVALLGTYLPH